MSRGSSVCAQNILDAPSLSIQQQSVFAAWPTWKCQVAICHVQAVSPTCMCMPHTYSCMQEPQHAHLDLTYSSSSWQPSSRMDLACPRKQQLVSRMQGSVISGLGYILLPCCAGPDAVSLQSTRTNGKQDSNVHCFNSISCSFGYAF